MKEIKAFVGHSFSPDDMEIVNSFLKYFDQLKDLVPKFAWDHAEAAEPVELAEKVQRKFAEANTFIGICTRNELAISAGNLSGVFLKPEYRKGHRRDFEAKTSDWIIQELGYAMGKGLPIIILKEEGVRRPGGLQGNKEYIPFTRDRPERAFGKVLEMLSALSPEESKAGATADAPKVDAEMQDTAQNGDDWRIPKPDWEETDYRNAILHLVATGELTKADELYASYATSDLGRQGTKTVELLAHQEFLKILFGQGGSLDQLSRLAATNPTSARVWGSLARAQVHFDNHAGAAASYETAANIDRNSKEGLYYLGRAALEYAKCGQSNRSNTLIEEIKVQTGSDTELERQLASAINDIVEFRKDEEASVVALERTVDLSPDNFDARFSLAYKHSLIGNEDLAFYHYLKIPYECRTAIAWNNLGVSYDHFKMHEASVNAYRKAEEMGETLAMSNLGYKFMKQGFRDEAKAEFDKGFAIEKHHKNIEEGLAALTRISEQESEMETAILEKAVPKIEFYRKLSAAISAPQVTTLSSRMQVREYTLSVSINGDTFTATGNYEVVGSGLASALFGGAQEKREYRIEYSGRITGAQIEAIVSRVQTGGPQYNGLLSITDHKPKVLMYLCSDGSLQAMENPHSESPTFYALLPA